MRLSASMCNENVDGCNTFRHLTVKSHVNIINNITGTNKTVELKLQQTDLKTQCSKTKNIPIPLLCKFKILCLLKTIHEQ